ncbi:MAG TPA: Plug domain-containing protein, partial [Chitinophagales bacterium]|nr:Plug domain-containing protein [Chitinophagales bacterium]
MFNEQQSLWIWLWALYNLLGLPSVLFAQQTPNDSILQYTLSPVDIVALPHSIFSAEQNLDSNLLKQFKTDNLSVFLQQHSAIYLKNYGANGLSSVGLRGMAAAQTAVVWNDMPLNSGMNGLCDLSTIPLAATQQVSLQYGTSSLASQSGGIGGAIVLNTRPVFVSQHRWTLQQQIGSFGQYNSSASMEIGSPKAHYTVQLQHQRAQNDYVYRNPYLPNFPRTRLSADSLRQYHALGSAAWQL